MHEDFLKTFGIAIVTPIDPGTSRVVAQRLNHYTMPGPLEKIYLNNVHAALPVKNIDAYV
jgi:hypothetical protein